MTSLHAIRTQVPGILALAVPIVAGLSAATLLGVTDSIMLAPLGAVALAAVGLTNAVAMVTYSAVYGVLMVTSVRIGRAFGAGEGRHIAFLLRNALALGALVGCGGATAMAAAWLALPFLGQPAEVLDALPAYWMLVSLNMVPFAVQIVFSCAFEAVGRPWLGAGLSFVGVIVNVPLNWVLIWGIGPLPPLGLAGAGLATLLAQTAALGAAFAAWRWARALRRLRLRRSLDWAEIGGSFREGAPLGLMYIAESAAIGAATVIVGTFGTVALAATQVAMAVGNVLYMVPLGVAGAVAIRVAQERGAGNAAALRPVVWAALTVATLWLAGSALFLWLAGGTVAGLITDDLPVATLAASIMAVFALMQVFDGVQSTMVGALRGLSDTAFPAAVTMAGYWGVALPLGWVWAVQAGWGPVWLWIAWLVALAGVGAVLVARFLWRTRRMPD